MLKPYWILEGAAAKVLANMPANSVDAVVTDPPSGTEYMGKGWDSFRRADNPGDVNRPNVFGRTSRTSPHSYGESERGVFIEAMTEVFTEVIRVLKPGGHGLVWALPRTSHWMATALEDVGFDIRDRLHEVTAVDAATTAFVASLDEGQREALARLLENQTSPILHHLFLNGMPKGQGDVRRELDMRLCTLPGKHGDKNLPAPGKRQPEDHLCPPSTNPLALARVGFATGLKPTVEHWILVRKPLEGTQAVNQIRWGTGALNVGATRVPGPEGPEGEEGSAGADPEGAGEGAAGGWPRHAVVVHASACGAGGCVPGCPALLLDQQAGREVSPLFNQFQHDVVYVPKAAVSEKEAGVNREGALVDDGRAEGSLGGNNPRNRGANKRRNSHPTVKPVGLMRHMIRLVTPPGGLVLDPFMGSGTTLIAAGLEGCASIGIEREPDYVGIARDRVEHWRKTAG